MLKFGRTAIAGIGACAMALVTAVSAPAWARASCTNSNHCYALNWGATGAKLSGVAVELKASCLRVASPSSSFLSYELWMLTNSQPGTATWVEVGMVDGGLSGSGNTGLRWFWADYRGRWDGFNQHVIGSARTGVSESAGILSMGSRTWHVYRAGKYVGSSVNSGTYGTGTEAGAETTTNSPYLDATAHNYRLRNGSTWSWANGTPDTDTPPFLSAIGNYGRDLHAWSSSHRCTTATAAQRRVSGMSATEALGVARGLASAQGERHPAVSHLVRTSRQNAEKLIANAEVADNAPSYVIQLRGSFVARSAPRPRGTLAPKGNTLTVTINSATGEITDWSLSARPVSLPAG